MTQPTDALTDLTPPLNRVRGRVTDAVYYGGIVSYQKSVRMGSN